MHYFDAHNHFHDEQFNCLDRSQLLKQLNGLGLRGMVVNGTHPGDWEAVSGLAERYPEMILPSFGVHPWEVSRAGVDWERRLMGFLETHEGRVGIGEVGLDRWMREPDMEGQAALFTRSLAIAAEGNLPMTIHCLRAWGPLLKLLRSNRLPARGFLIHSVGASEETIRELADLGAYFSVSGPFGDEQKLKYQKALEVIPFDRLLVETDAPSMLPPREWRPYRTVNKDGEEVTHPANILAVYDLVAAHKGIGLSGICSQVAANVRAFFGICGDGISS